MKAISTWIWVVGGVVIAIVLLGLVLNIISNLTMQQHEQAADAEFSKMISNVNALCDSNEGQSTFSTVRMPDIVNRIYATKGGEIQETERTYGNYLCMNISKPTCKKLDCLVEMYRLERKETVIGLVDRLLGKRGYNEYELTFIRTRDGVSILSKGMKPREYLCNFSSLINYNKNPVLILEDNVLLVLDTTPLINGTDENFMKMLKNTGNYFGKRIGIIWEDSCVWNSTVTDDGSIYCPEQNNVNPDENPIIRDLRDNGYNIDIIFHDRKISSATLSNYNQIWLIRPGWCEFSLGNASRITQQYCINASVWSYIEIRDIKDYTKNGGGVVIFADYSPNLPERVVNTLLEYLDINVILIEGYLDGEYTTEIINHEITQGITKYPLHGVGKVRCRV